MRTKTILGILFPIALTISCNDHFNIEPSNNYFTNQNLIKNIVIHPYEGNTINDVFKVTLSDLGRIIYNSGNNPITRSISQDNPTIEPFIYNSDTIMYLINGNGKWMLYSIDKRMPIVLAENYEGHSISVQELIENKAIEHWIQCIADEVEMLKTNSDFDAQSESLQEWSKYDDQISTNARDEDNNDWIYIDTEIISNEPTIKPHLLSTSWHQTEPFNTLVPYKKSDNTQHCPAGCVAVATSQYLYYLKTSKNIAIQMPNAGSCTGYYDNYTQSFWAMTDTVFSHMALNDNSNIYNSMQFDKAATMIGYVGKMVGTSYGEGNSSSTASKTRSYLSSIGINSAYEEFSESAVLACRSMGYPVLAVGNSTNSSSHMWVIDGCKYDLISYDEIYANISDSLYYANGNTIPEGTLLRRVRKTRKENALFLMNWGWNLYSNPSTPDIDNTFYRVSDSWEGFDIARKIIYK